jgi:hypothetical protein
MRLVDAMHNATLHLCEVEPFVKDEDASGECKAMHAGRAHSCGFLEPMHLRPDIGQEQE